MRKRDVKFQLLKKIILIFILCVYVVVVWVCHSEVVEV